MNKGLVLKSTGSSYSVKSESGEIIHCTIKGKLRTSGFKSTNPVCAGDWVIYELSPDNSGLITDIADRKNYLIRKSTNLSKQSNIIAANIDIAVLIITLAYPETPLEFADRFLVIAEAYQVPVIIVINKVDLYKDTLKDLISYIHEIYEPIGYKVIETSVVTNLNINVLYSYLQNKVSVLSGYSGVGKSSLINAICPSVKRKTGNISDYHQKGKHTTTFAEMISLDDDGYIIDTPGIKGFGIINIDRREIFHHFPEIFKLSSSCQYNNCLHLEEPNCAVKKGVESNVISYSRYASYVSIMEDMNSKYR